MQRQTHPQKPNKNRGVKSTSLHSRSARRRSLRMQTAQQRNAQAVPVEIVERIVWNVFGGTMHSKRVESMCNAIIGVTHASKLSVQGIGHGLASALGKSSKHAIKQVDRLLSNRHVDPWQLFEVWVPYMLSGRREALIALDWTEFAKDGQSTCSASLVTAHGRSTALVWKSVEKSQLRGRQTAVENELIELLHRLIPPDVDVTLLADRGFASAERFVHLTTLGWDYVIRFRENIQVTYQGRTQTAASWVPKSGHAKKLLDVGITGKEAPLDAVVCVHKKNMKQAWCLATSLTNASATHIAKLYARRFTIEETFRDHKDLRFGLGLSATHIRDCGRRDRLLLLAAIAHAILTLLGAAAESLGYDRLMRANTVRRRTHSLFRQGCYWYARLPNLDDKLRVPLLREFERQLSEHAVLCALLGVL